MSYSACVLLCPSMHLQQSYFVSSFLFFFRLMRSTAFIMIGQQNLDKNEHLLQRYTKQHSVNNLGTRWTLVFFFIDYIYSYIYLYYILKECSRHVSIGCLKSALRFFYNTYSGLGKPLFSILPFCVLFDKFKAYTSGIQVPE